MENQVIKSEINDKIGDRLFPRESAALITGRSKDVFLCEEGISKAADVIFKSVKEKKYNFKVWKEHELHPKEMTESTVDWIFVLDSLNFSFWSNNNEPWTVSYNGENYTGYWALCASINRALKEGIPITTPSYYANVSTDDLQHIFRSETQTELPLLEERARNLTEAGKILVEEYENSFVNFLKKGNQSAKQLLELIVTTFPSFKDEAKFDGQRISFYKRAQILIADIWACFEGAGFGLFPDINFLTMFADYKVPQSLLYLGVLKYSPSLMNKLREGEEISPCDRLELEIRGNSIWAVQCIYLAIKKMILGHESLNKLTENDLALILNSVIIDFYLWDFAKENLDNRTDLPCHKTRTIFY